MGYRPGRLLWQLAFFLTVITATVIARPTPQEAQSSAPVKPPVSDGFTPYYQRPVRAPTVYEWGETLHHGAWSGHSTWIFVASLLLFFAVAMGVMWEMRWRDSARWLKLFTPEEEVRYPRGLALISRISAVVSAALGVIFLVGWLLHFPVIVKYFHGFWSLEANAAIGYLAGAVCIYLASGRQLNLPLHIAVWVCTALVNFVGWVNLIARYVDPWLDPDRFFLGVVGSSPSPMRVGCSGAFVLLGAAFILLPRKKWIGWAQALALTAALPTLLGGVANLYSGGLDHNGLLGTMAGLSVVKLTGFLLLSTGILFCHPTKGLMKVVTSPAAGGIVARRLLPAGLLMSTLLGWVCWHGFLSNYFDVPFGLAFFAITNAAACGFLVWNGSALLNRLEVGRSRLAQTLSERENEVRQFNLDLEKRVEQRTAQVLEAHSSLSATRARLQGVFDAGIDVGIMVIAKDNKIQLFSKGAERLLQYSSREVVDRFTLHMLEPYAERLRRAADISATVGFTVDADDIYSTQVIPKKAYIRETAYRRKDGTQFDVSLAVAPLLDQNGKREGTVVVFLDISTRKRLERQVAETAENLRKQTQKAEDANRAKSDFLAAMSHEIRTPMNAILGMADLLWETELDPAQREYVGRFRRAGSSLLTLINDILDLSKIESGRLELELIDFNLIELTDRVAEIMSSKAHHKGIELFVRVKPGIPDVIIGDPVRLQQILVNLVGNAVKFTERGHVMITVSAIENSPPGHVRFEVADTGVGIPENKLESIFEDFTQAESSTTRRFGGTGLGLGISRRLVQQMGGSILVKSTFGQGSTFFFELKFPLGHSQAPEAAPADKELAKELALVLDGNPTSRLIITELCSLWGIATAEAESLSYALSLLQSPKGGRRPTFIIVSRDLLGDNYEKVREIRAVNPALPLLMTTSQEEPREIAKAKSRGIAAYATNPVRRSELKRVISSLFLSSKPGEQQAAVQGRVAHNVEVDTSGPRLLIAEDSDDNRFLIQAYLRGKPFDVTFAENGQEAVRRFESSEYDLVFMDMQMPIMDGLLATRTIRTWEREKGKIPTPIVALTASALPIDHERSKEAGCTSHLTKPISQKKLLEAVERFSLHHPARKTGPSASPTHENTVPNHEPSDDHNFAQTLTVLASNISRQESQVQSKDPIKILVPSGLEELVPGYLDSRKEEMPELLNLANTNDFDKLKKLAHNLKGTGSSYGFTDITRLGAAIEAAAKVSDKKTAQQNLNDLANYLSRVELTFEEMPA